MTPETAAQERLGGIYAFGAYFLWGFMPLYFILLAPIGPWEVVVWRILFSLVFCAILLTVTRTWPKLIAILIVFWVSMASASASAAPVDHGRCDGGTNSMASPVVRTYRLGHDRRSFQPRK